MAPTPNGFPRFPLDTFIGGVTGCGRGQLALSFADCRKCDRAVAMRLGMLSRDQSNEDSKEDRLGSLGALADGASLGCQKPGAPRSQGPPSNHKHPIMCLGTGGAKLKPLHKLPLAAQPLNALGRAAIGLHLLPGQLIATPGHPKRVHKEKKRGKTERTRGTRRPQHSHSSRVSWARARVLVGSHLSALLEVRRGPGPAPVTS